ncbi:hypothetical protein L208DRAFT_1394489 [Tricholoma matsutake]|nr:hypothetical protein L208DRAFT_1394489 [Tricholoma matsutake 945]
MAQWLTPSSHSGGHTLALLVRTLTPPKSLVGIAERQWSPTLLLIMVCMKAFSSAGVLLDAHIMHSRS